MKQQFTKMTVERSYLVTWQEAEDLLSNEDFQRRLENGMINCSLKRNNNSYGNLYELTFTGILYADKQEEVLYTAESIAIDLKDICSFAEKIINGV